MRINTEKVMKRIGIIITVGVILIPIIFHFVNSHFFGFDEDKRMSGKYLKLLNINYQKEVVLFTSFISKKTGYVDFYIYKSDEICIMDLNQYNAVNIKDINVNNYLLTEENKDFSKFHTTILTHQNPYHPIVNLSPGLRKAIKMNLFIDTKIEKIARGEKTLYIKFRGNTFELNGIKKYAELTFGLMGVNEAMMEILAIRNQDKTFLIVKYGTAEDSKDKISLLDMIDVK